MKRSDNNSCIDETLSLLKGTLKDVFSTMGISSRPTLERAPKEIADYALPCFTFAKELKKNPALIAEEIETALDTPEFSNILKFFHVETKGAYLNFRFRTSFLVDRGLIPILRQSREYGTRPPRDEFIILEHTSANPNGPFHVGRARNPIIGDTLSRLLRKLGYSVEVQYWVNDMGRQAATLAWGKLNLSEGSVPPMEVSDPYIDKNDHVLVRYYQEAHRRITETPELAGEIDNILFEIERGNEEIKTTVREFSIQVLEGMKNSLSTLNIHYDRFVWESATVENGTVREVINDLKTSEYAHRDEGAWYLELEDFGITGRSTRFFFTRGDGTSLYTTRDLAYHLSKLRQAQRAINILGEDHKLQAEQLKIALTLMGSENLPESIFYSFVSLEQGKMSTRKGQVVYLDDLIQEALHRAYLEVSRRRPELSEDERKRISRIVGLGCIRYNIIRVQADKRIVFRWEEALNFEGDSSPFLQYAHARCSGILDNARKMGWSSPGADEVLELIGNPDDKTLDENEKRLLRCFIDFPEAIDEAGSTFKPHLLPKYLQELASTFNNFYQSCPVVAADDEAVRKFRLSLVECTRTLLAEGLGLLGIEAPESM